MKVTKRDGSAQTFMPNKILSRIKRASRGLKAQPDEVFKRTVPNLHDGISTTEIDELTASECHSMSLKHPDYGLLGARILLSRLYKNTGETPYLERGLPLAEKTIKNIKEWGIPYKEYKETDISSRGYLSAFSFIKEYALSKHGKALETPLEMYCRIFAYLANTETEYQNWIKLAMEKRVSMASPILLNAGTASSNMISCTSMSIKGDSREGITSTVTSAANHSSRAAGLGIYSGLLRSKHSYFKDGKGKASGLVRGIKIFEPIANFFRQTETRKGAAAVTCDIWHRDVEDFIVMKDHATAHRQAAHDLFFAISIPNLFYKRVVKNSDWMLVCPHEAQKFLGFPLYSVHGQEFDEAYEMLESVKDTLQTAKTVRAKDLMRILVSAQASSGVPYVYNRDNGNKNHNHNHLGTVRSQQLCNEFLAYHDAENEAQCCLGAIPLPSHVSKLELDKEKLAESVQALTIILNRVIDSNEWNTEQAAKTGRYQRAIGIGLVGLAEMAFEMDEIFTNETFKQKVREVQEAVYFNAITASNTLAKQGVPSTECITNSPLVSKGIFRFGKDAPEDAVLDWEGLRKDVMRHGLVNSLFCCNMPTSSTSKLLGLTESFEPIPSPITKRRTVSGEFLVVCRHLYDDLESMGKLDETLISKINAQGSVKGLGLPSWFERKYATVYEVGAAWLVDMAIARQPYVDMGESMNLYYTEGLAGEMARNLVKGAMGGLTSGVYYTKMRKQTTNNSALAETARPVTDNGPECFGCSA